MTVIHNGRNYTVKPLADGYWKLTEVGNPRNQVTLNRQQMIIAGLGHAMEGK